MITPTHQNLGKLRNVILLSIVALCFRQTNASGGGAASGGAAATKLPKLISVHAFHVEALLPEDRIELNYRNRGKWFPATFKSRDKDSMGNYISVVYDDTPNGQFKVYLASDEGGIRLPQCKGCDGSGRTSNGESTWMKARGEEKVDQDPYCKTCRGTGTKAKPETLRRHARWASALSQPAPKHSDQDCKVNDACKLGPDGILQELLEEQPTDDLEPAEDEHVAPVDHRAVIDRMVNEVHASLEDERYRQYRARKKMARRIYKPLDAQQLRETKQRYARVKPIRAESGVRKYYKGKPRHPNNGTNASDLDNGTNAPGYKTGKIDRIEFDAWRRDIIDRQERERTQPVQLYIKVHHFLVNGQTRVIEMSLNKKIQDLKQKIFNDIISGPVGLAPFWRSVDNFRLTVGGKRLDDPDRTLNDYGIKKENTIRVMRK